jgi:Domain of unknown function (DUF4136)
MIYRQISRLLGVGSMVSMLLGCATTANVDYREDYDFSSIHNIRIMAPTRPGTTDTRINSPLVDERVRKTITDHLVANGFEIVDGDADANLTWQLSARSGLESRDSGISLGLGTFGRHSAVGVGYGFPAYDVDSYDEGVLTVDVLSARDNTLLWRGSSSRRLVDGATPQTLTTTVQELVGDVLANFPPRR